MELSLGSRLKHAWNVFKNRDPSSSEDIIYLCDGEVETCAKTHCFKNGRECSHTPDVRHAVNFVKYPDNESDFFVEKRNSQGDR